MIEVNLNELLVRKQNELEVMHEELDSIGGGSLNISNKNDSHYFIERVDGEQIGITKDMAHVMRLARKTLLNEKVKMYEQEVEILKDACERIGKIDRSRLERVKDRLSVVGNEDFNYSEKELLWLKNRMSKNPRNREFLRFKTDGGVLTRSKSERYIGNFLERKRAIFMYEAELEINGYLLYPDFTILCPDGRVVIWEHCGMMDKVDYYLRNMVRTYDYKMNGYAQFDNLICTYDEDLDNIDTLEMIYRRFLI